MEKQIKALEKVALGLEPSIKTLRKWNDKVTDYGLKFIDEIYDKPAYQKADEKDLQRLENFTIEEEGKSISKVLKVIERSIDSNNINPASGGHLGYIPGGGIYPSSLADYLVDISNRYAGIYYAAPGAVKLENQLIRWVASLINYPKTATGNIASGGSIANLIAITTARDAKNITSKNITKSVVYLTKQVHHCIHKALIIAGLREVIIREIDVDDKFRMDIKNLKKTIKRDRKNNLNPFMIIGSIGTTDVGAVDPIDDIAELSKKHDCWFHIDAAYGGFFVLVDQLKQLFKGVEKSDSIVLDPHKTLFLPYGCGMVLVKDADALHHSHQYTAPYMQDAEDNDYDRSPAQLSPELTKHFRGMRMWLPLQLFGLKPFKACIAEKWKLTKYFYTEVQKLGFEVGPVPELSVAIYRYVPKGTDANEFNKNLVDLIKEDGTVFVSSTMIDEVYWIRIAIVSFRTHLKLIKKYLRILERSKNKLLKELK